MMFDISCFFTKDRKIVSLRGQALYGSVMKIFKEDLYVITTGLLQKLNASLHWWPVHEFYSLDGRFTKWSKTVLWEPQCRYVFLERWPDLIFHDPFTTTLGFKSMIPS
ncbi:hypothetical protein NPIL_558411 [Nephila pilipes]|uniref:Uncharacterized protein n=1 Tax=Nephila pilipes TaxID=299642 RepID=A0A8X6PCU0_NEPPI|nr:hypothetical protein NPIL_558411 [Nephila pilipes]